MHTCILLYKLYPYKNYLRFHLMLAYIFKVFSILRLYDGLENLFLSPRYLWFFHIQTRSLITNYCCLFCKLYSSCSFFLLVTLMFTKCNSFPPYFMIHSKVLNYYEVLSFVYAFGIVCDQSDR